MHSIQAHRESAPMSTPTFNVVVNGGLSPFNFLAVLLIRTLASTVLKDKGSHRPQRCSGVNTVRFATSAENIHA